MSTDTWILQIPVEDRKVLVRGLEEAGRLATPSWRRLARAVLNELKAGARLDPRRVYSAIAPVVHQVSGLAPLAVRIKDAVELEVLP